MNKIFKEKICKIFNWSEELFDDIYSSKSFRAIRHNPQKISFEALNTAFANQLTKTPFYKDSYYISSEFEGVGNMPYHHGGGFYVQEPSASSVLSVLDIKENEKVLDLCAAPGGKSTGIGIALKGTGLLWSNEYVRKRAATLLSNIERMGIANAVVSSLDSEYLAKNLKGFFDKVLVDAPCSGEGMWRHNPKVEEQWSEEYVIECAKRQKEILQNAAEMVTLNGKLIYSTCTFSKEENEDVVEWFLENRKDFKLVKINADFGMGGIGENKDINDAVKRILPTMQGEGHFIAMFERIECYDYSDIKYIGENISPNEKKTVLEFLEQNFINYKPEILISKNNMIYAVPNQTPDIKGDILRTGLFLGEMRKNRFEPSHALFTAFKIEPKQILNLKADDSRVEQYLKGMEIECDEAFNGYVSVRVCGCPLGFGKKSRNRITNKYPKGLRLL